MSVATHDAEEPVRRAREIEDPTNLYFIHPISARLVPIFAEYGITPNTVSFVGMGCGILAGASYYFYGAQWAASLGFVLMLAWHVMDGADGQLARLTKTYSELGKVLDGICDYVTFTAVYVGLALAMTRHIGGWAWALVTCSGIAHAVQSAAYEMQRQDYNFLGWGRQSAALPKLDTTPNGLTGLLHQLYARVQLWASGGATEFREEFAIILATEPERAATLRAAYRVAFAPAIRRWGILCANYRTLGLFIAALIKQPALYFVFEILGLGAVLIVLLEVQKAHYRSFLVQIRVT
ncbi:CDP-alcohol phosphatidyltransferase family protein [Acidocella sp.]|uniref:CDP-alcohol phosphatidyltransferase family protein n=1 Tax=Acidocella sp. TaxID=50710 RepID=UPI00262DB5EC|nr:CDP-alcohol phosphatidyltransferase family protein [Acidocella sp.]